LTKMSIEKVFERFYKVMQEQYGVRNEDIETIWDKNRFCICTLTAGPRKGELCYKKSIKNKYYCVSHDKNDL
jgi:hypothetical protein